MCPSRRQERQVFQERRKLTLPNVTEKSSMLETKLSIVFIKAEGIGGLYRAVWVEWWREEFHWSFISYSLENKK